MNVKLPRIINDYINASNAHDVRSILSCFSDDAAVHDEEETLHGKKAIEGWITKTIEKYKFQFKPLRIKEDKEKSSLRWRYRERSMEARSPSITTSPSRATKSYRSRLISEPLGVICSQRLRKSMAGTARDPRSERLKPFQSAAPSTTFAPRLASMTAVASPIRLPAEPARRSGRMLPACENFRSSKLAPVMTTTLSLIPSMKSCFSTLYFPMSDFAGHAFDLP